MKNLLQKATLLLFITIGLTSCSDDDDGIVNNDSDLGTITSTFSEVLDFETTATEEETVTIDFTIESDMLFDFEIISANFDTVLTLLDSSGEVITSTFLI